MNHRAFGTKPPLQPPPPKNDLESALRPELLFHAALAMATAETVEETLGAIAEQTRLILHAHVAATSFRLEGEGKGDATHLSASSFSDSYARYELADEAEGRLEVRDRAWGGDERPIERSARGWLEAPLVDAEGEALGNLRISGKIEGDFTERDEALFERIVAFASSALQQARLRDERVDLLLREHIARTEAETAVRARDVFLSVASHELKTPLTTLRLQTDLLARTASHAEPELRQRFDSGLVILRRQLDRLETLVAELLDVSRLSAGQVELHPEPMDFAKLVEETTARLAEAARTASCAVEVATSGPVLGSWDKTRLDQIVTNLLSNAIKYGAGKPVHVSLETSAGGDSVILRVRDHGIGIAPEAQGRLFRRFERLVSERNYRGLGLGLWIVRQIIDQFGGTIRVESELGEGATFIVELPLNR